MVDPGMQQLARHNPGIMGLLSMQLQAQRQLQLQQQLLQLQTGSLAGIPFGAAGLLGNRRSAASSLFNPANTNSSNTSTAAALIAGNDLAKAGLFHPSEPIKILGQTALSIQQDINSRAGTDRSKRSESFPVTLHRLLTELEQMGESHIACFVSTGDAFSVQNPRLFEKRILKDYFPRMGSFGSFQRQLNLYDFKRISNGDPRGAYTHHLFHKAFPQLAKSMKRTKIKGNTKKNASKKINNTRKLSGTPQELLEENNAGDD